MEQDLTVAIYSQLLPKYVFKGEVVQEVQMAVKCIGSISGFQDYLKNVTIIFQKNMLHDC